jgi:hypothetical protein
VTLIDDRGRLFGRVNLVDAAVGLFVVVLIPVAYGTFLLFRPSSPRITSVERVPITMEERRLAGGSRLSAKLKVRGSGFRPMLRASIDQAPALGFVFENPNSADVLVGETAPGTHDLVIYDGVQEVARAPKAITIQAAAPARIRVVGTLFDLDGAIARALRVGPIAEGNPSQGEIVKLGDLQPGRRHFAAGHADVEVAAPGRWERQAILVLQCDLDPNGDGCALGGIPLTGVSQPVIRLIGPTSAAMPLSIDELLPTEPPQRAVARVRFSGASVAIGLIHTGDRDDTLDDRAATVTALGRRMDDRDPATIDAILNLGVDRSREGWRYRGHLALPGAPFRLSTDRYVANGSVIELTVEPNGADR